MRRFLVFRAHSCLRKVFFPTSAATDLSFFFPVKTFPVSGAALSIKSAPTLYAAGTTYRLKNGIAVLPIVCAKAPNPLPLCLAHPLKCGKSLSATIFYSTNSKNDFQKFF